MYAAFSHTLELLSSDVFIWTLVIILTFKNINSGGAEEWEDNKDVTVL